MASFSSLRTPIWGESRAALARAALRRDPILRGEGVPRGGGAPVRLIAGFPARRRARPRGARSPIRRGEGVPRGDGAPVLLIAGLMGEVPWLRVMARWLRDPARRTWRAGRCAMVDCVSCTIERLEAVVEALTGRYGRGVTII